MRSEFAIVLAVLGFAITIFLSCADNPALGEYPSIDYFFPESSSSVTALSSSRISSSSSPVGSACTPSNNNATYYCSKSTLKQYGSLTYGGKTYKTIEIGTQTWMAQNLNYDTGTSDSGCYDKSNANCTIYGRLYNINALSAGVCPPNWHLPTDNEWGTLMLSINPSCSQTSNCANAGKLLKATSGWDSNGNGTDAYGFAALPGGYYENDGFKGIGGNAVWWSSSYASTILIYYRRITYNNESTLRDYVNKNTVLLSVRCVKN